MCKTKYVHGNVFNKVYCINLSTPSNSKAKRRDKINARLSSSNVNHNAQHSKVSRTSAPNKSANAPNRTRNNSAPSSNSVGNKTSSAFSRIRNNSARSSNGNVTPNLPRSQPIPIGAGNRIADSSKTLTGSDASSRSKSNVNSLVASIPTDQTIEATGVLIRNSVPTSIARKCIAGRVTQFSVSVCSSNSDGARSYVISNVTSSV